MKKLINTLSVLISIICFTGFFLLLIVNFSFAETSIILKARSDNAEDRQRRADYFSNYYKETYSSFLTNQVTDAIWNGEILLEMTEEQVRASWGEPDHINRTTTKNSKHEQWIYEGISVWEYDEVLQKITRKEKRTLYLFFDDGVFTSWQD